MIRIVGVQRNESAQQEFILLQNQGSLRLNLRGHMLMSDCTLESADLAKTSHLFRDEVLIPPGNYVILYSGAGEPHWAKTKDQQLVYYAYMQRPNPVWNGCSGPMHVLSPHHTYAERREALLIG